MKRLIKPITIWRLQIYEWTNYTENSLSNWYFYKNSWNYTENYFQYSFVIFTSFFKAFMHFLSNLQSLNCNDVTVWSLLWHGLFHTRGVAMFQYSCTIKNLHHSPAACAENYLLYCTLVLKHLATPLWKSPYQLRDQTVKKHFILLLKWRTCIIYHFEKKSVAIIIKTKSGF